MTIVRNKITINTTEEEREAIKIVANLAHDIYYGLNNDEVACFNGLMKASRAGEDNDADDIEVGILDLSCLLDDFQKISMNLIVSYNMF